MSPLTIGVDLNRRGGWEIALPGERDRLTRETLDEARRGRICAPRIGIPASWSCVTATTARCIASSSTARIERRQALSPTSSRAERASNPIHAPWLRPASAR
jgi:hypothetical protein